jgi:opacity protein-like surface antigen
MTLGGSLFTARAAGAAEAQADMSVSSADIGKGGGGRSDAGAFLAAGKIGGIASFNGLSPFVIGGLELGYVFPGTKRTMGALLDVTYTAPNSDGSASDARVPSESYKWELRQKELVFQPTFLYRLTSVSDKITPYAGIGPRIYLLQSVTRGSAGGATFQDSTEKSTKFGFGIPLGAELALGPGGLFAEFLFQWGPLTHKTTGDTSLASGSLFVGYRALL